MAVVLAFSGCRKQQAHQVDQPQRAKLVQGAKLISVLNPQHADSLVLMAYKQGDYQRMLTLTDSLSARGELNELRTRGYRATAYRGMKDMKAAIASLRRAIEVEDVSDNDYFLMVHLKTLYAELQQLQGNSEGALRTALALIEQLRSDGYEDSEFCQRLYSVLGESQLNLDHPDEAAKYFERMYGILQKSIRNDSVGDHLMEGVEALGNVTSTYLANEQWDQAELWVDRLDSVFTLCRGTRYAADYPGGPSGLRLHALSGHALCRRLSHLCGLVSRQCQTVACLDRRSTRTAGKGPPILQRISDHRLLKVR